MVNAYLARFAERAGTTLQPLDENGYTQTRKGSATIGLNVLDDHGAPAAPRAGHAGARRPGARLSIGVSSSSRSSTTADAAFAIDAAKDEVFVRALRRLSGLDYEEFEDLLDTVGRVADEWDDALKREFGES